MRRRSAPPPQLPKRRPHGRRRTGGSAIPLLEARLDHRRPGLPLADALRRDDAEAHLVACRLSDRAPHRLVRWLEVTVPPARRDHLVRALARRGSPGRLALASMAPDHFLVRVTEPAPATCVATFRAGGLCAVCPLSAPADRTTWRVILPRGRAARTFFRDLHSDGRARLALTHLRPYRSESTLTARQDRALRTAYELGFFGYPRRGSLAEVAHALGVGRSATLEILRRATAKLAEGRYANGLRLLAVT